MALPVYDWTRPTTGESFKWSPLSVGKELDISAAYSDKATQHLLHVALVAARLRGPDGRPVEVPDVRDWDQIDFDDLLRTINRVERERAARLLKQPQGNAGNLEVQARELDETAANFLAAVRRTVAAAQALPVTGPLGPSGS